MEYHRVRGQRRDHLLYYKSGNISVEKYLAICRRSLTINPTKLFCSSRPIMKTFGSCHLIIIRSFTMIVDTFVTWTPSNNANICSRYFARFGKTLNISTANDCTFTWPEIWDMEGMEDMGYGGYGIWRIWDMEDMGYGGYGIWSFTGLWEVIA